MKQHTPGPWAWYERPDGQVYLATPNLGHLVVMDFVRLGMQYAQPRFADWDGDERGNMGGVMRPAKEFQVNLHPDARLIENAPILLAACREAYRVLCEVQGMIVIGRDPGSQNCINKLHSAIADAEGRP